MSVIEKTITFFRKTLGQDIITLSIHSDQVKVEVLDEFVVRAAAKGLLVEVWIEGDKRDYQFGDYVELLKRESNKVDLTVAKSNFDVEWTGGVDQNGNEIEPNPYLDEDYAALHKEDDGHPKG